MNSTSVGLCGVVCARDAVVFSKGFLILVLFGLWNVHVVKGVGWAGWCAGYNVDNVCRRWR